MNASQTYNIPQESCVLKATSVLKELLPVLPVTLAPSGEDFNLYHFRNQEQLELLRYS